MIKPILVTSCLLVLVAASCSEFKPGSYEGGGRTGGPIIIGNAGSGCSPAGSSCTSADQCCSHVCDFVSQVLECVNPSDSGPQCKPNNQGCSTGSECCSTYCSPSLLCANPPPPDAGGD